VIDAIKGLLEHETAGDPVSGVKWTRKTTQKVADELKSRGIRVGRTTVGRLLKEMKCSLKAKHKKIGAGNDPDRNEQFEYISRQRKQAAAEGIAVISVDTKKKELVGRFKKAGASWRQEAQQVNDHDFRSTAIGMAVPYGIYDERTKRGFMCVGTSYDTPEFAVQCIVKWWRDEGGKRYPNRPDVLIVADGGGSNGSRSRLWKSAVQEKLCDRFGLSVSVAHYPPGASKWNPIEHRLFSEISKNWAGEPLDSYETILKFIRTTKTTTGLKVRSRLVSKQYKKGIAVSDERMEALNITRPDTLPKWNYTLNPIQDSG